MKRLVVLGVLAASGALTMTLAAFQQGGGAHGSGG